MTLRTQLALTFLALTILPLGGLLGYSYYSSSRAVRGALEEEAAELAGQMDSKLATARQWVAQSVENVDPIALETLIEDGHDENRVARQIVRSMGSAAPLVRSFEFVPFDVITATSAESSPDAGGTMVAPTPQIAEVPAAPTTPPPPAPAVPEPPAPPTVVIDMQEALKEVEAEREQLKQVPIVGHSLEFAFKTLESIPMDMIINKSIAAAEQGLTQAEAELEAERAEQTAIESELESERREQEIERKREAIRTAREQFRELSRRREASVSTTDEELTRRTVVFSEAPEIPVVQDGEVVGSVRADVHDDEILREIFLSTSAQGDEIPFAIDASGEIHTRSPEDEAFLQGLGIRELVNTAEGSRLVHEDQIIATTTDPETGLVMGVVRPAAEALAEVRKATIRSLGLGLGLVGICLIGVLPLANHMTRDIGAVTAGAERISQGDLDAEVVVDSRNEVGRLAAVFNRMAKDLKSNQQLLVEEEAARREQEIREQLLKTEYERTASELEDARQFQLSMLPSSVPVVDDVEIAVEMTTATEVGGDYYDFHASADGLTVAIGDGTGHGAKAGTMVAVIKSLFTALRSSDLQAFLREASATIRSMQLGRMSMALTLMRLNGENLRYAAAGMPPLLIVRATGEIEELSSPGAPLGTMVFDYQEREVSISVGDTIVAMSDGLPELPNENGDPFGYERVIATLRNAHDQPIDTIIGILQKAAKEWRGSRPQNDDMTLLVMRYRPGWRRS